MEEWLQSSHHHSRLPPHCDPQGEFLTWLSSTTRTCVPTPLALTSTLLGSLSLVAWLFAQAPQIYKNYKLKSTVGLSIHFLAIWLLGDTTNLAGAILTKQAAWQILVAIYYTLVDLTLCVQYVHYSMYRARRRRQKAVDVSSHPPDRDGQNAVRKDPNESHSQPKTVPSPSFKMPGFGSLTPEKGTPGTRSPRTITRPNVGSSLPAASPRTVITLSLLLALFSRTHALPTASTLANSPPVHEPLREVIGQYISWFSTLLYLGSRMPQIIKNARRKSTSGLSLSLFVAAFFGNLFYSSSILTNPLAYGDYPPYGHFGWADKDGNDHVDWILRALPFFLGAAGVLAMDGMIAVQFLLFDQGIEDKKSKGYLPVPVDTAAANSGRRPGEEDVRGRNRFRRVSGWMRGWVPSPSPSMMSFRSGVTGNGGAASPPLAGSPWGPEGRPLLDESGASRGNGNSSASNLSRSYGGTT